MPAPLFHSTPAGPACRRRCTRRRFPVKALRGTVGPAKTAGEGFTSLPRSFWFLCTDCGDSGMGKERGQRLPAPLFHSTQAGPACRRRCPRRRFPAIALCATVGPAKAAGEGFLSLPLPAMPCSWRRPGCERIGAGNCRPLVFQRWRCRGEGLDVVLFLHHADVVAGLLQTAGNLVPQLFPHIVADDAAVVHSPVAEVVESKLFGVAVRH